MMRPFVGHRRYSITHRAVQRLRELVPGRDDDDDESLRDRLDVALGEAEDGGKAIRTLDAMLGEPQTLIPIDAFGDLLYAIIKEDTVVTVLPQGHGEEILQRGQAMEQRVASGQATVRAPEPREDEARWGEGRRRWRKDAQAQPVVIERITRGAGNGNGSSTGEPGEGTAAESSGLTLSSVGATSGSRVEDDEFEDELDDEDELELEAIAAEGEPVPEPRVARLVPIGPRTAEGPIAQVLVGALELGRRRAAVAALRDVLRTESRERPLLPLWNALAEQGLQQELTIGDLIDVLRP